MIKITCRNIKPSEQKRLIPMVKALYREDPGALPATVAKITRTFQELLKHPEKGAIIILETDGQIAGYSILINYWSNEYGGNVLSIDELFVKPRYRGKGLATHFLQYLSKGKFNDAVGLQIEVNPKNSRARKLYERLGFKMTVNQHLFREI